MRCRKGFADIIEYCDMCSEEIVSYMRYYLIFFPDGDGDETCATVCSSCFEDNYAPCADKDYKCHSFNKEV